MFIVGQWPGTHFTGISKYSILCWGLGTYTFHQYHQVRRSLLVSDVGLISPVLASTAFIVGHSSTMEPCVVWEFPFPPIGDPDCHDVINEKPCIVGAQPMGNYANK